MNRFGHGISLKEIAERKLHHGNGIFKNPFAGAHKRGFGRLVRWKLFSENRFKHLYNRQQVTDVSVDWESVVGHSGLSVTFLKHACLFIRDSESNIIIDPVFFGLFGWFRDFTPLCFETDLIPKCDLVLITHGHYDHLDRRSLFCLKGGYRLVSPLGYRSAFRGLPYRRHTRLDWFESIREKELEVTLLPCNHWTMRNPFSGPNRSLWGSFLIRTRTATIFLSGDTAFCDGFREIGELYDIDLAVFNLGAYEPRWFMAQSHINPQETVKAFKDLGAERLMIVHWGTFRLGDEPVFLPPEELKKELRLSGLMKKYVDIAHGGSLFF